ncbi:hypothetical protein BJ741DRAFT_624515 [Chytriomyces cf. hyalinus JEL632]|nr:hypothetical protein BJ741DRAFT_624515 [Chytriomyces cf. hyalinus JEL632]
MSAPEDQKPQIHANTEDMFGFVSTEGYSHGFFSFFTDPVTFLSAVSSCSFGSTFMKITHAFLWVLQFCCGCLVVGQTSGKLHKGGNFDVAACLCSGIGAYRIRRKVQAMYKINESEDASACSIGLCGSCAVTQDVREMNKREAEGKALVAAAVVEQPQMSV